MKKCSGEERLSASLFQLLELRLSCCIVFAHHFMYYTQCTRHFFVLPTQCSSVCAGHSAHRFIYGAVHTTFFMQPAQCTPLSLCIVQWKPLCLWNLQCTPLCLCNLCTPLCLCDLCSEHHFMQPMVHTTLFIQPMHTALFMQPAQYTPVYATYSAHHWPPSFSNYLFC